VLTQNMNKAPMPIVAALNGDAMGVGFELAVLLAGPDGGGITGQVISVDGGYKV
jgi:enoyl-[acyl-carrier-protein] reductase (NADH)